MLYEKLLFQYTVSSLTNLSRFFFNTLNFAHIQCLFTREEAVTLVRELWRIWVRAGTNVELWLFAYAHWCLNHRHDTGQWGRQETHTHTHTANHNTWKSGFCEKASLCLKTVPLFHPSAVHTWDNGLEVTRRSHLSFTTTQHWLFLSHSSQISLFILQHMGRGVRFNHLHSIF